MEEKKEGVHWMKIAYLDCFSGISGDMILGAMVDTGLKIDELSDELSKLKITGFSLESKRVVRGPIAATKLNVIAEDTNLHRHLPDIVHIIDRSSISPTAKQRARKIFERLAEAEAKVHGTTPDKIHFHEVGGLDAIVDIVGTAVGLELMGIEKIYSSALRFGSGFAESAHGVIPIPAPAVLELCKGVPSERTDVKAELVTPTGAAILTSLSSGFGTSPKFRTESIGYGAGGRDLQEMPNVLRLQIGQTVGEFQQDYSIVVETNIDDMTSEIYGYILDRMIESGAKDAYLSPVVMKKGRPGIVLSVLCDDDHKDSIIETILNETTTIGVRTYRVDRVMLERESGSLDTALGPVKVKIAHLNGSRRITPEFDDCARIAREREIPILEVYAAVQKATGNKHK